jgi:hypothetical protein
MEADNAQQELLSLLRRGRKKSRRVLWGVLAGLGVAVSLAAGGFLRRTNPKPMPKSANGSTP